MIFTVDDTVYASYCTGLGSIPSAPTDERPKPRCGLLQCKNGSEKGGELGRSR